MYISAPGLKPVRIGGGEPYRALVLDCRCRKLITADKSFAKRRIAGLKNMARLYQVGV